MGVQCGAAGSSYAVRRPGGGVWQYSGYQGSSPGASYSLAGLAGGGSGEGLTHRLTPAW